MGSDKGASCHHCCKMYIDDLNHHLQATGVGCYVGGTWVYHRVDSVIEFIVGNHREEKFCTN